MTKNALIGWVKEHRKGIVLSLLLLYLLIAFGWQFIFPSDLSKLTIKTLSDNSTVAGHLGLPIKTDWYYESHDSSYWDISSNVRGPKESAWVTASAENNKGRLTLTKLIIRFSDGHEMLAQSQKDGEGLDWFRLGESCSDENSASDSE